MKDMETTLLKDLGTVMNALIAKATGNTAEKLQVVALYGMQVVAHEFDHPKGMLQEHFKSAYEWDNMDIQSFQAWRDDVSEMNDKYAGKQKALPSLLKLFNKLKEAEEAEQA